ncbi:unnamed protein product [Cladocopium goreaui]|uniref:Uncharacterized protein n=1 Tax=Cladocopium goreaui TaxID=2562237 RepID=A0A9P1BXW0_9DINO|nr:unnamed protein product [Cladocopium goreaui]
MPPANSRGLSNHREFVVTVGGQDLGNACWAMDHGPMCGLHLLDATLLTQWAPQNRILMQMPIYRSFLHLDWTCLEFLAIQTASTVGRLSMKV